MVLFQYQVSLFKDFGRTFYFLGDFSECTFLRSHGHFQGFRLPTFHDYHKLFKVRRNFSRSSFLSISSSSLSIKIFYFLTRSFWFFSWLGPLKFFRSSTFKYFGLSKTSSSMKPQPPLSKDQAQDLLFENFLLFAEHILLKQNSNPTPHFHNCNHQLNSITNSMTQTNNIYKNVTEFVVE